MIHNTISNYTKSKLLLPIMLSIIYTSYMQNTTSKKLLNTNNPLHQSTNVIITIYNIDTGKTKYKITAKNIYYHNDKRNIYFNKIFITVFNEYNILTWSITSDQAKLNYKKILLLSGNVQIQNEYKTSYFKKIKTNNSTINLITHDIYSNEPTTIYGNYFISKSMKMHSNLLKNTT